MKHVLDVVLGSVTDKVSQTPAAETSEKPTAED
jgi:hypothetical protein